MDWFFQRIEEYKVRKERRRGPLSASWLGVARGTGGGLSERVRSIREIRDIVHNFVRVGGAPKNCRVDWANLADLGAGAAGFEDAPDSFDRPFILLDKHPFDTCDPAEVVDTYCGIGFHEKGHISHTRDFYRRIASGLSGRRRVWENLLEDERIEERIRCESPGFAPFLDVAREVLLDRQQLGQSLNHWEELPDLDKVNALIFAFLRSPHLLTPATRVWTAVNGECVFQSLCDLFSKGPVSERDVIRGGGKLEELFRRLSEHYSESALEQATARRPRD